MANAARRLLFQGRLMTAPTRPSAVVETGRRLWKEHGGRYHGPHVETAYMVDANLNGFLRAYAAAVLDNLPREVMVATASACGSNIPYALIDSVINRLRKEILGHEYREK